MMIKEALQYLVKLGNTNVLEVDGRKYSTENLHDIYEPTSGDMKVYNLRSIVDYIKANFDGVEKFIVRVESPREVDVFSPLNKDKRRNFYLEANAEVPRHSFGSFENPEQFNIYLQSAFVQNEDRDILLKVAGNIKDENVKNFGDDGVSQQVTMKTGAATVSNVIVPNPVVLAPYRTFSEVKQPESAFVFRMKSGPYCGLFEADGGAWKGEAMKNIKDYLQKELSLEINSGKVLLIG